jgi:MFS family permease
MTFVKQEGQGGKAIMVGKRRWFVYGLLFSLLAISMLDRINMSVAGSAIAKEMGLGPEALGLLFSSFLWIYLFCLLPAGAITDRLGTRRAIAGAVALWSVFQLGSGLAGTLPLLLLSRLGLGTFESFTNPGANSVIRQWSPRSERGLATAMWISGSLAGPSVGALLVSWLVSDFGWRASFLVTGCMGMGFALIWWAFFRLPEQAPWLDAPERALILDERDMPTNAAQGPSIGYRGLLASPTIWGLFLTQGCLTYTAYFFLSWLPGYMQTAHHLSIMGSGVYTALPYGMAIVLCLALSRLCDRLLSPAQIHQGKRRYAVALGSLATSIVLATPFVEDINIIVVLFTIALTCTGISQTWNFALTNDLLRTPADLGRAFAFLTLGGNSFGLLAPIVTGYLVGATGSFNIPFVVCGVLALIGALLACFGGRTPIGENALAPIPQPALTA